MNETVSKKGMNKPLVALIGLAVLAVALFFVFRSGGQISEAEVIARCKEELALFKPLISIEPEQISASVSERSVTYSNVTIISRDMPEFSLVVDKIVQSGVDEATYRGEYGERSTIERQSYSGVKLMLDGQHIGTLQEYVVEGTQLNYRDLLKTLRENQDISPETAFVKLMPVLKDCQTARAYAKDFKLNMMFINVSIESMEARDISMSSYGQCSMNNFEVGVMGRKVFSTEKLGVDAVILPGIFRELMADPEGFARNNPDIERRAGTDPLSILAPMSVKNFHLENVLLDPGSPVSMKKFAGDFSADRENLALKTAISDLLLTRDFFARVPELAPLAELVTNDMHLDGNFDMAMLGMGGNGKLVDIDLKTALREAALGGFSLNMLMDTPRESIYNYYAADPAQQRIKFFEFNVENNGIVDFLVACCAAYGLGPAGYDETYDMLLDSLYQAEDEATNKMQKEAIAGIIQMVEEGGSLKLSFKPAQPVSLLELDEADGGGLENMGLDITYTPAGK